MEINMDWRIWLALGIGVILKANLAALLIGLLVVSREEMKAMSNEEIIADIRRDYAIIE
jgi:hypothetical protein